LACSTIEAGGVGVADGRCNPQKFPRLLRGGASHGWGTKLEPYSDLDGTVFHAGEAVGWLRWWDGSMKVVGGEYVRIVIGFERLDGPAEEPAMRW